MASSRVSPSTCTAPGVLREPVGAQPHLLGRFLAAGVQHACGPTASSRAAACSSSVDLPMPGSPPMSDHRAGHDAAAQHEVELGEAGAPARERRGSATSRSRCGGTRRRRARRPRRRPRRRGRRDRHRLLRHRVPRPAPLAPPRPLRVLVAALGAAIDRPRAAPCSGSGVVAVGQVVEAGVLACGSTARRRRSGRCGAWPG